ncbi:PREDICTED: centrosomal protein of 290 kDa-like [Amphimedon queenslandica]|uniref:Uncharacterized protein n=2 Tax=Amphimedon queenslandica TaxID=400682 RepID=A0AAN0K042_AMPQE|nr:PREDICTED: centrosomal protein of 290 kDa-like [Amphimedon queenslandica]|eukprot:XP_019862856.1 PREDICTED: centrosomal protein of 290 kDa-like [Amphimedon queenslandica]
MASNPESVLDKSRELSALLTRLEENLTKSQDKNDALLEAIETAETRALDMSASASELSLLRNLRARLAASHAPNAELKNDLPILIKSFKEKFQSLDLALKQYKELTIKLQQDDKDMKEQQDKLNKEREIFNEEREKWQRHIEQARNDISEQNDRLTFLSQQLTGTKVDRFTILYSGKF